MKKKYLKFCSIISQACGAFADKVPGGDKLMEMALAVK